jgi:hypothetical protein
MWATTNLFKSVIAQQTWTFSAVCQGFDNSIFLYWSKNQTDFRWAMDSNLIIFLSILSTFCNQHLLWSLLTENMSKIKISKFLSWTLYYLFCTF